MVLGVSHLLGFVRLALSIYASIVFGVSHRRPLALLMRATEYRLLSMNSSIVVGVWFIARVGPLKVLASTSKTSGLCWASVLCL
ncbi:hypothetical protein FPQ18DRAFT_316396 [Pyronema domesticum]|nr:hypothetical protein FPQ18DRAFT_316396 [Pyronema domesticum]